MEYPWSWSASIGWPVLGNFLRTNIIVQDSGQKCEIVSPNPILGQELQFCVAKRNCVAHRRKLCCGVESFVPNIGRNVNISSHNACTRQQLAWTIILAPCGLYLTEIPILFRFVNPIRHKSDYAGQMGSSKSEGIYADQRRFIQGRGSRIGFLEFYCVQVEEDYAGRRASGLHKMINHIRLP